MNQTKTNNPLNMFALILEKKKWLNCPQSIFTDASQISQRQFYILVFGELKTGFILLNSKYC